VTPINEILLTILTEPRCLGMESDHAVQIQVSQSIDNVEKEL
jgi:hypothetical protein